VWQGSAFGERCPELVAAGEVLMQFKNAMQAIVAIDQPSPDVAAWTGDPETVTEMIIARAHAVAQDERQLRARVGLADSTTLETLAGEPHITIIECDGGRIYQEKWGFPEPHVLVERAQSRRAFGDGLRWLAATDDGMLARQRLTRTVERELGSTLTSAAWNRPSALAGWRW
jgi:hypothetical protein